MQANPVTFPITKPRDYKIFILLAVALGLCLASSSFIRSSFWLDECISVWASSNGLLTAGSRSWNFQGQSPLYYILLSGWIDLFGRDEIIVRLFSALCLLAATVTIFQWIKKTVSLPAAFTCCFIFLCQDATLLALSARPYALGILFCVLTMQALFKFTEIDNPVRLSSLTAFVTFGTLAIYSHYFAALNIMSATLAVLLIRISRKQEATKLIFSNIIIIFFCLPLLPQLKLLHDKASEIAFAPAFSLIQLLQSLLPTFPVLASTIACATCATLMHKPIQKIFVLSNINSSLLAMALTCWVLPTLMLLTLSILGETSFLLPRYLSFSTPAFAILLSLGFSKIQSDKQTLVIIILASLLGIREINRTWAIEDWRGSIAIVSAKPTPLLIASGLAELNQINWLENKSIETKQYLLAPVQVYNPRLEARAVPTLLSTKDLKNYFISQLESSLANSKQASIIFNSSSDLMKQLAPLIAELKLTSNLQKTGLIAILELKDTK